ncbi:MAG TPA: hypothetical protein VGB31_04025 [Myxococcota bacterium]
MFADRESVSAVLLKISVDCSARWEISASGIASASGVPAGVLPGGDSCAGALAGITSAAMPNASAARARLTRELLRTLALTRS